MRHRTAIVLCVVLLSGVAASAQRGASGDQFVGAWSGTWDGAGSSGGFDLTLERPKDGAMGGRVAVTGEPSYKATLQTIAFDGNKMTAKYEFTPDPQAEVLLVATFEGSTASGTWSLREKASGNEVVSGTWKVARK